MLLPCIDGLSSKDVVPTLREFLGSVARLCAAAITRLTESWQEEYRRWGERDLPAAYYVYCSADGLPFGVRLDADRVCTLVVVRADGKNELVALADAHQSQAGLLRDARRRGMRVPVLSVGDGALGFWAAPHVVPPEASEQRSSVRRAVDTLHCLPKSAQPAGRQALVQIGSAEHRFHAQAALRYLAAASYLNAVAKITQDADQFLAFFDLPAERWFHLNTSNSIVISSGCWGVYKVTDEGCFSRRRHVLSAESPTLARANPLVGAALGSTSRTGLSAETCLRRKTPAPLGLLADRPQITIESTFAAVRLRTTVTKGAGNRATGLAMVFKLIEPASQRWRMVDTPRLLASCELASCQQAPGFEKECLSSGPTNPGTKSPRNQPGNAVHKLSTISQRSSSS